MTFARAATLGKGARIVRSVRFLSAWNLTVVSKGASVAVTTIVRVYETLGPHYVKVNNSVFVIDPVGVMHHEPPGAASNGVANSVTDVFPAARLRLDR